MAETQKLLGFIPARAGSQRVKDKNVRPLAGRSLIERTLNQAMACRHLDGVGFSTDSSAYLDLARKSGLDEAYLRPASLAGDAVSTADCVIDYVNWRERKGDVFTHIVLLQATSPFRSSTGIDRAIAFWRASGRSTLASVRPAAADPRFVVSVHRETGVQAREGASGLRDFYVLDGAVFIAPLCYVEEARRFWNEESALFIHPYACYFDIDTETDFATAEALLSARLDLDVG